MFEVSLTRLFSIRLSYHFAFMVISISMLGIGSAGTVLAVYAVNRNYPDKNSSDAEKISGRTPPESVVAVYSLLAGISVVACYIISNYIPFDPYKFSWDRKQFLYLALYCLLLSVPFFCSGILIATVFFRHSGKSMLIYSSDLLGAGLGSLAVLLILNITGPEYSVLTASTLCFIGALIIGNKIIRSLSLIFLALNLMVFIAHPDMIAVKMSPYKPLSLFLTYPGSAHLKTYHTSYSRIDTFMSPAARFAPGLSLKYPDMLPEQIGLSIDGDNINAVTGAGNQPALRFLEYLPSSIAYELRRNGDVLVIDPKGGLNALMAERYGPHVIHKIESNPMTVKIIRDDLGEFSGNLYDRNTWTGYGRNFLNASPVSPNRSYDVIDLSLTGASVSGFFGISEDYRFTVEAFGRYLSALNKNGILSISLYLIPPPRTEFRILATIISAVERMGENNILSRIAAVRSWDSMTILVKESPFTIREIEHIKAFSGVRYFDLVYYPGIKEDESNRYVKLPSDEYFEGFRNILHTETRTSFVNNYLFDIKPVYDNSPFFHYYLKALNFKTIYEKMGRKWLYFLEEGYLLPVIFMIVLLASLIIILLPVFVNALHKKNTSFRPSSMLYTLIYFSMLGIGFMFVEVSIIQKSILLLENPSYSLAVVLTAILISSGAGSMISSRYPKLKTSYSLLILSLLILLYTLIYPMLLNVLSRYALEFRIVLLALSLVPLGFFMGIPFPMGIGLLGQIREPLIPWAWAVNACMSVLAPVLTIMIALIFGFRAVMLISMLSYLTAYLSFRKLTSIIPDTEIVN